MSPHWTDTENQSNVGLIRPEMHIKVNIMLDYIQFYHYIKENKDVLMAAGSSEKYYWKRNRKSKNILLYHRAKRNISLLFFTKYGQQICLTCHTYYIYILLFKSLTFMYIKNIHYNL